MQERKENAKIEPLTDAEKRLFLAAMERERQVCRKADRASGLEPYEDTLEGKVNAIERKIKAALW